MKNTLKVLLPLSIFLSGCSYNLKFEPIPAVGQKEVYDHGVGILISTKTYTVIVAPNPSVYNESDSPTVAVYVVNNTAKEFNFSTDNIRAFVGDEELKVYSYEELFVKIQRKSEFASLGVALNSALQSANAAYAQSNSNFYTTHKGQNGGVASTFGSVTTVNTGEIQKAQREIARDASSDMAKIESNRQRSIENITSSVLRKTTIMPYSMDGGYIILSKIPLSEDSRQFAYIDCRRNYTLQGGYDGDCDKFADNVKALSEDLGVRIVITVEDEKHEFKFGHSKVKAD